MGHHGVTVNKGLHTHRRVVDLWCGKGLALLVTNGWRSGRLHVEGHEIVAVEGLHHQGTIGGWGHKEGTW